MSDGREDGAADSYPLRCDTCRWWRQDGEGEGECRRFPPRAADDFHIIWPWMEAHEWCGEHAPKEARDE